jgi:hypothetical protein
VRLLCKGLNGSEKPKNKERTQEVFWNQQNVAKTRALIAVLTQKL